MLCIICLLSLIRITITGYQFEYIQAKQEMLLGEQRFFLQCDAGKYFVESESKLSIKSGDEQKEMNKTEEIATKITANGEQNDKDKPSKDLVDFVAAEIEKAEDKKEIEMVKVDENKDEGGRGKEAFG